MTSELCVFCGYLKIVKMSSGKKEWDCSQLRKYDLNLEPIPRLHYKDPKVDELMGTNVRDFSVSSTMNM